MTEADVTADKTVTLWDLCTAVQGTSLRLSRCSRRPFVEVFFTATCDTRLYVVLKVVVEFTTQACEVMLQDCDLELLILALDV